MNVDGGITKGEKMKEVICGKDNCQYSNGGICTLSLIELDDDVKRKYVY